MKVKGLNEVNEVATALLCLKCDAPLTHHVTDRTEQFCAECELAVLRKVQLGACVLARRWVTEAQMRHDAPDTIEMFKRLAETADEHYRALEAKGLNAAWVLNVKRL